MWIVVGSPGGYASQSVDNGATWNPTARNLNQEEATVNFTHNGLATDKKGTWMHGSMHAASPYDAYRTISFSTDNGVTWKNGIAGDSNETVRITALGCGNGRFIYGESTGIMRGTEL